MFHFSYQSQGNQRIRVLHPDDYDKLFVASQQLTRVIATTDVGKGLVLEEPLLQDVETVWILDQVVPDPAYHSGYKAKAVSFKDNPDSTEVQAVYTHWMCLSWFVPVGATYKE